MAAALRTFTRAAIVVLLGAGIAVSGCSDRIESPAAPAAPPPHLVIPDLRAALAAQRSHTDALLKTPGVVGTAVTLLPDGRPGVQLLLARAGIAGLPQSLDGIPVTTRVTGRLMAFSDPTKRQRPAPMGFSVGHPEITAGTIGARVRDALGRVYILSNNHVLANSNGATVGDPEYQPGVFDGGTAADQIATLSDFQTISFGGGNNTIDAAIALSDTTQLDNTTPLDDGYGMPNSTIYGDANGDGLFDDRSALLGLAVQKYGRTTQLTHGQITAVNATVTVCYDGACLRTARYIDQLIIEPGGFSAGGDSGSLIVTDDGNLNPVALLFAGSATVTIANRIDLVLQRFGVSIDGFAPPPPGPLTDVAVIGVSGPNAAVQGSTSNVTVTIKNFGNQNVTQAFNVVLQDTTAHVTVGTQSVAGLAVGASASLTFAWTPTTTGSHTLMGSHTLSDDKAANNQRFTTIPVNPPVTDIAITGFSGPAEVIVGHGLNIGVTVANTGNENVTSSFSVTLRDSTGGTIGTQTVNGLAVGASSLLVFSWNTTNATIGRHTLIASHSFSDDSAANNQLNEIVLVDPKPTDIAVTAISAPHAVAQGDTAHVIVTVQNVGEVVVSATFAVQLTDGSAGGAVLGTRSVAGLAIGASATVDIPWNTAGAAIAGHTLIATEQLADDNETNNSMAIGVGVTPPPPPPSTDLAVSAIDAPSAVIQGSTATIGVTVQNVGGQAVTSSFNVVLTDATAGTTIGTQAISSLAVSGLASVSFSWNTTGTALGGHTLVATQQLSDANAANNSRSVSVSVNAQPVDLALTGISAPGHVTQGDIVPVVVTVQNVGGLDVTSNFDVVLTDGSAGNAVLGTQTISGLAAGATATRTFNWNTAGAALNGHTLFATQKLADVNPSNNSAATGVIVNAPPVTDIAVSNVTAPAAVTQGNTASVAVSIANVGGLTVSQNFDIVLTDATAGVTIGTQTVPGLAASSAITRMFNWTTATTTALGTHSLVATITLTDANAGNNQASTTITVNAPTTDIGVTAVTAPSSVLKGNTPTISVTVQNVGGLTVSSTFNVVLTDATAGVTIGTQSVAGLAVGATATRSFTWSTGTAAVGNHTLVATQTLVDDNASNDQRSVVVTVNPQPADVALANITAPSTVTAGDTVPIAVTVQNVGGQDVTTNVDVVLTDGTAGGLIIGTQTVPGLALGASATLTFNWNTAGAALNGHTLTATQKLADPNTSNDARAIAITVSAPSVHVGNLDGRSDTSTVGTWSAIVVITAHDAKHNPLNGVTVHGNWNSSSADSTCVTSDAGAGGPGTCTVVLTGTPNWSRFASYAVTALTRTGYVYKSSANHDPDGSSNGFSIILRRN